MNKKLFNPLTFEILQIFSTNPNDKIHGRNIAKRLNANQMTVLLNLNKLEEDKIFLTETKGKNKNFFLNKKNELIYPFMEVAEIYRSMQMIDKNFLIYSIIKDIKELTKGVVIIFGSYAKGCATKESDIDILIIDKITDNVFDIVKNKYPVDIHIMNMSKKEFINGMKTKKPFIKEIIEHHIIMQGSEEFTRWLLKYGSDKMVL